MGEWSECTADCPLPRITSAWRIVCFHFQVNKPCMQRRGREGESAVTKEFAPNSVEEAFHAAISLPLSLWLALFIVIIKTVTRARAHRMPLGRHRLRLCLRYTVRNLLVTRGTYGIWWCNMHVTGVKNWNFFWKFLKKLLGYYKKFAMLWARANPRHFYYTNFLFF